MLLRLRSTLVMSVALALPFGSACSLAEDDANIAEGGQHGGDGPNEPPAQEVGYEETETEARRPPTTGGGDPGADGCSNGVRFEMAPNATHGRVSAAFAVAALEAGTWPDINQSLLSHDEFLAYFAPSDASEPFGRVRTDDVTGEQKLDLFVSVPPDDGSTHLILVVDTSTSMRNDLALAGEVARAFGEALTEDERDAFTIVEWGSDPRIFTMKSGVSTVSGPQAADLGAEFEARALDLTSAQLGPGGSLGPAQAAVNAAIDATPATPHIVVLTDGGVEADGDAFAAIESWATKQSAVISFVEIAGASGEAVAEPRSFHREQLASMALAGGGLTHFVTEETLPGFQAEVAQNFRIGRRSVKALYEMPGIIELLSAPGVDFAAGDIGSSLSPRWAGVGRPVFTSVAVKSCVDVFNGTVSVDGGQSVPVAVGNPDDLRLVRLALIDKLYAILKSECDEAKPLIQAFGETDEADNDLRVLVDKAAVACGL